MFNILIDTSVWLDLAQDQKQTPLLESLVAMVRDDLLRLIVPQIVLDEFQKNRQQVAQRAERSLSTHFNLVKDAIRKAEGDARRKSRILEYLSNMDHRIPLERGIATATLDRIETLLKKTTPLQTSDPVKLRAADRALSRRAPCQHENKNGMADAVLIEVYFECVKKGKAGERFAFVTHNKHDFSEPHSNHKTVHPQLAQGFSKVKSLYFITLGDCLRRIDPGLVQDVIWETTFEQEVRSLSNILEATDRLTTQVWYNRHKNLEWAIRHGKRKIVSREEWEANCQKKKGYGQTHTIDNVWEGALRAGKRAEQKLGKGNFGPWDDFEWGMLNGKLSALRWVLGEEWDMLDT